MKSESNHAVKNAVAAFSLVPKTGALVNVRCAPAIAVVGHVQAIVRYGKYWIASVSTEDGLHDHGWMCVIDADAKKYLGKQETPGGMSHPGGMQVCGDYL
ncbi:MAG: hypothetical protein ABI175_11635, partial [Polyangiales bacterium]